MLVERDGLDGSEPGLECVFIQVVLEDFKAAGPDDNMILRGHVQVSGFDNKIGEKTVEKKTFFCCFFWKTHNSLKIKKKNFQLLF